MPTAAGLDSVCPRKGTGRQAHTSYVAPLRPRAHSRGLGCHDCGGAIACPSGVAASAPEDHLGKAPETSALFAMVLQCT